MKKIFVSVSFLFLFVIIITQSCKKDNIIKDANQGLDNTVLGLNPANMSGEEIFRGIYFLDGDLANHIEELVASKQDFDATMDNVTDDDRNALDSVKLTIVNRMNFIDPDFFSIFRVDMISGDPYRTKNALIRAGGLYEEAIYSDTILSQYLLLGDSLASMIDIETVLTDGHVDITKLKNTIDSLTGGNSYAANTMKNFGMQPGRNITACATTFFFLFFSYQGIAAYNYAVGVNVAGAFNAWLAINITKYINATKAINISSSISVNRSTSTNSSTSTSGGGGGGTSTGGGGTSIHGGGNPWGQGTPGSSCSVSGCHAGGGHLKLGEIADSEAEGLLFIPQTHDVYSVSNTETDIVTAQLTEYLSSEE